MRIEVWSDVVCPWCYIGKRNLDAALSQFDGGGDVEVVWRSFELDPSAPSVRPLDYLNHLASKYRISQQQAQSMIDRVTARGAAAGIDFRFDIARPGNTFDAHRVLHLAADRGVQTKVAERFFAGTFTEGAPIGEVDAIIDLAVSGGLDSVEVAAVLGGDGYAEDVRADEQGAGALGITAVPFYLIDGAYGLAGAHPPGALLQALEQAAAPATPATT